MILISLKKILPNKNIMTIKIILKDTQLAQNVGMVARVMLNFKLNNLILINPRDNDVLINAHPASCDALDFIDTKIYDSLPQILDDTNIIYAFSARKRYLKIPQISIYDMFNEEFFKAENKGILFGGEKNGLSNEDISYANYLVYIPTNDDFPSLNLAQGVGLFAYEVSKYMDKNKVNYEGCDDKAEQNNQLSLAKLNFFYHDLFDKLTKQNFFANEQRADITKMNIKALYSKLNLSSQEIDTLIAINKMLYGKNNE